MRLLAWLSGIFADPYTLEPGTEADHIRTVTNLPADSVEDGCAAHGLVWSEYLRQFVVTLGCDQARTPIFKYAVSDDLIVWSNASTLLTMAQAKPLARFGPGGNLKLHNGAQWNQLPYFNRPNNCKHGSELWCDWAGTVPVLGEQGRRPTQRTSAGTCWRRLSVSRSKQPPQQKTLDFVLHNSLSLSLSTISGHSSTLVVSHRCLR